MHFSISALVDCIWTIFKSCGMCQDHVKGCLFHRPKIGLAGIPGVFQRNVSCIVTSACAFIWTSSEFCENAHKHVKRCFSLVWGWPHLQGRYLTQILPQLWQWFHMKWILKLTAFYSLGSDLHESIIVHVYEHQHGIWAFPECCETYWAHVKIYVWLLNLHSECIWAFLKCCKMYLAHNVFST
jgi:hypothetical protein